MLVRSMTDNPYLSTAELPRANSAIRPSRWHGVGLSILSAIVGLMFGWQTLMIYAFSTMVDPQLRGDERARVIAHRFFFGDGPFQIVFICVFMCLAATGLISAMLFLVFAFFRQPSLKVGAMISCCTGALVTMSIVGYLLTR